MPNCHHCGREIRDVSHIDYNMRWVHENTENMFCAIDGVTPVFVNSDEEAAARTSAAPAGEITTTTGDNQ